MGGKGSLLNSGLRPGDRLRNEKLACSGGGEFATQSRWLAGAKSGSNAAQKGGPAVLGIHDTCALAPARGRWPSARSVWAPSEKVMCPSPGQCRHPATHMGGVQVHGTKVKGLLASNKCRCIVTQTGHGDLRAGWMQPAGSARRAPGTGQSCTGTRFGKYAARPWQPAGSAAVMMTAQGRSGPLQ